MPDFLRLHLPTIYEDACASHELMQPVHNQRHLPFTFFMLGSLAAVACERSNPRHRHPASRTHRRRRLTTLWKKLPSSQVALPCPLFSPQFGFCSSPLRRCSNRPWKLDTASERRSRFVIHDIRHAERPGPWGGRHLDNEKPSRPCHPPCTATHRRRISPKPAFTTSRLPEFPRARPFNTLPRRRFSSGRSVPHEFAKQGTNSPGSPTSPKGQKAI